LQKENVNHDLQLNWDTIMEHWTGDDNHLLAIKVNILAQYCPYVYNMKYLFTNTAEQ